MQSHWFPVSVHPSPCFCVLWLTSHSFCSSRCSFWPRSGRGGRNFHFDQLGETAGSHHWCATSTFSIRGDHMLYGELQPLPAPCSRRVSRRLHALSRRWKHGAEPPRHGDIGDSERPPSREVVQHQHLRRGGYAGERACLCTGPHRWRRTDR